MSSCTLDYSIYILSYYLSFRLLFLWCTPPLRIISLAPPPLVQYSDVFLFSGLQYFLTTRPNLNPTTSDGYESTISPAYRRLSIPRRVAIWNDSLRRLSSVRGDKVRRKVRKKEFEPAEKRRKKITLHSYFGLYLTWNKQYNQRWSSVQLIDY